MSTSFTPGSDLLLLKKLPEVKALFTTFAAGHFIKPAAFVQPVRAAVKTAAVTASECSSGRSFSGCYRELFIAAPIDLDYEEPNAVTESAVELVQAGNPLHELKIPVFSESSSRPAA
jgi:hypothetical protein